MAAHGTATHLPAGPMAVSAPLPGNELREYEKILTISDEIFSGSHPRLRVPQHLVRKPGSRNGQTASVRPQLPKTAPSRTTVEKVPSFETTNQSYNSSQSTPAGNALSAAPQSARVASKPTSEIDPIFLTKSDDLVRAELQLQRQRVERQLRDQVELRRVETKQKTAVQDTKPEFDVSEVFKQALEVVKPVSLSDSSEASGPDGPASDFDNNSYYSSRAPDSPLQAGAQQKSSPVAIVPPAGPAQHGPVTHYPDELQRLEALNQPGSDQEMQDAYHVADQRPMYSQTQPRYHKAEDPNPYHESLQIETADDSEYSPPAPAAPLPDARDYPREMEGGRQLRTDVRYIDRSRGPQKPSSPANVRVVQNHITSPAAPRPSRVSPLATAKVPPVQHLRDGRVEPASEQVYSDPDSTRGSPANAPTPVIMSRKRRRLREGGEEPRQVSYRTRNAEPVETYIKEEPVSPPPFADDPTTVRSRHPQERPIYIDVASSQYAPVYESRGPPIREPVYEVDPYHELSQDSAPPRTISRLSTRRPIREDADLRRVASLQYARQSDYPREYMEAPPRPMRAASYVVERPVQERPRYYEEAPSYSQHRYIPVDDLPPPTYRDPYYEEAPTPRMMAPQRRIVYDEHGNQYYEVHPTPRYQPMAPPPRPLSQMSKAVYDDQVPHRTTSVRAPSVVQDPYVERRYLQEMPPPQPIYRRVAPDYARPISHAHERQPYATPLEGHEPYSRSGSVQVEYLPPRHPAYLDERGVPQERVIRTASVRPPQPRYEEPHEIDQRVGSVRPPAPGREVSVFMEGRPVGEYVERPYYIRDRRYYDGEGEEGDHVALDGANDTVQRVRHYQ
ncbi:hypothetical protein PENANT_c019G01346 [Penicillium antarcticum]|uniref:Uncharacterized protein n=1 Tax=Penicillium antarcticum TaxID=416450 RepID=A0A1V6Q239_9EURO|nr:uncharacterized protein N7508_001140 [Penicillium antarcticum]KAJ5316632.1 hypothetical protein N7508_001140 [Penicillium antarcticum]OQD82932.1 hypothetical protein PENANT_c019G01346 [Penicillium antarcticum]